MSNALLPAGHFTASLICIHMTHGLRIISALTVSFVVPILLYLCTSQPPNFPSPATSNANLHALKDNFNITSLVPQVCDTRTKLRLGVLNLL